MSSTLLSRLSLPLLLLVHPSLLLFLLLLLAEDAILLFPPSCAPDTVVVLLILRVWHRRAAATLSSSRYLHYVVKKMTINDMQCKRMTCLCEIGNSNIRLLSFGRFATSISFPESLPVCHLPRLVSNSRLLRLSIHINNLTFIFILELISRTLDYYVSQLRALIFQYWYHLTHLKINF